MKSTSTFQDGGQRSPVLISRLARILWPLMKRLFRIEITGEENLSQEGPFLLIGNHNSGALVESHSLLFLTFLAGKSIFGLNHKALFRIPLVGSYFRKIGAVAASGEAAEDVLRNGHALLIFPGGNRQALRPLKERHINSFPQAKGWAKIAVAENVPVIPVKFTGTHMINPIFASNEFLSRALVLPWFLGIRIFPVSLAQVLAATVTLAICLSAGAPTALAVILTYLAFVFSCLTPVVPAKVKIEFLAPLTHDMKLEEDIRVKELRHRMAVLMDSPNVHKVLPRGKRKPYPLNGIERFMFLHESEEVHYNSHIVFDFEADVDRNHVLATTDRWIEAIPHARTNIEPGLYRSKRYVYDEAWFDSTSIVEFHEGISEDLVDQFANEPFDLKFEPPVRFGLFSEGSIHKLIFSCHHSIFDGAGQMLALDQWSKLYNGDAPADRFRSMATYRYRSTVKYFGWKVSLHQLLQNLRPSAPRIQTKLGNLVSNPHVDKRYVRAVTLRSPSKRSLRKDFYVLCLKALDTVMRSKGEENNPLLCYLPVGLRQSLKVENCLQNTVVSHTLFAKRASLGTEKFAQKVALKTKNNPLDQNTKFIFGVLPLCQLAPEAYTRKMFAHMDSAEFPISCSALLVNASVPPRGWLTTPKTWKNLYISARGTLLKSPGIGIVLTGFPGSETITIEYLEEIVQEEDVLALESAFREMFELAADDKS